MQSKVMFVGKTFLFLFIYLFLNKFFHCKILFRLVSHTVSLHIFEHLLSQIATGAPSTSSQSPPPAELSKSLCNIASVDRLREQKRETELNSTVTSKSNKNTESDLSQSKTIVNDSCLMELFKKCQTCGQPISKKNVSHCGAQKMVRWSCLGGHRGTWMSSPHLWEAFPEIHVLTALSILFSGGTFTHFKKWAKHLHLNFMGHKTFFEIQKAYLNPEMKQMHRTKQEEIFTAGVHQQCSDDTLLHISGDSPGFNVKNQKMLGFSFVFFVFFSNTSNCRFKPKTLLFVYKYLIGKN